MSGPYDTLLPRVKGEVVVALHNYIIECCYNYSRDELSPLSVVEAGSAAGMLNWMAAIVPDTLKSRLQTAPEGKYRGVRDVFSQLVIN